MKSRIILILTLVLLPSLVIASDFKVMATPERSVYSIKKDTHQLNSKDQFIIHFKVSPNDGPNRFWIFSCSWTEHWKSDNPKVGVIGFTCTRNVPHKFELTASHPYVGDLPVVLNGVTPGEEVKFHLHFSTYKDKDMKESFEDSQSNEVEIKVVE